MWCCACSIRQSSYRRRGGAFTAPNGLRAARQTHMVYDALREPGTASATELAHEGIKRKGFTMHDLDA